MSVNTKQQVFQTLFRDLNYSLQHTPRNKISSHDCNDCKAQCPQRHCNSAEVMEPQVWQCDKTSFFNDTVIQSLPMRFTSFTFATTEIPKTPLQAFAHHTSSFC